MPPSTLADLVADAILAVERCLASVATNDAWQRMPPPWRDSPGREPSEREQAERIAWGQQFAGELRQRHQAEQALRATARQALDALTRALAQAGEDMVPVLQMRNALLPGGGGAQAARATWQETKAQLEALLLRLEIGDQGEQSAGADDDSPRQRAAWALLRDGSRVSREQLALAVYGSADRPSREALRQMLRRLRAALDRAGAPWRLEWDEAQAWLSRRK